jgi:hypothetical protein
MNEFSRRSAAAWMAFGTIRRLLTAAIMIIALAACATANRSQKSGADAIGADPDSPSTPDALERRAVERWQFLIDGQPDKAYEYLSPGFRTTVSQREYARNAFTNTIKWNSVTWRAAECATADACEVQVLIGYSVRMAGAGDVASINLQKENWVKVDGEWYFLPNQ